MKTLVLYHKNCLDGFAAAFSAWLILRDEAEYIPIQYGDIKTVEDLYDKISVEKIKDNVVCILDFSFPKEVMNTFFSITKKLIWLDHHHTVFEMWCGAMPESETYVEYSLSREIILDNNRSGAMITWDYFHPNKEIPRFIKHIDDYDRWQFKIDGTKEFNKALWSRAPWSFKQWEKELVDLDSQSGSVDTLINEGTILLKAHDVNVRGVVRGAGRYCVITLPDGTTVPGLAANCPPHLQSDVGNELAALSDTYGLLWYINKDGLCLCSLRSIELDISTIAKAFGGGGHQRASGFTIDIQELLKWIR